VVSAKRDFVVEDPALARLMKQYAAYVEEDKAPQIAWARKQLLARRFSGVIRPGEPVALTELVSGAGTLPEGYSASVKWYPGPKSLRVVLQVKNPYYGLNNVERLAQRSWVQYLICASGASDDITRFGVSRTPDGKAEIYCYGSGQEPLVGSGKWKSFNGGYVVDVDLPYSRIKGFDKSWARMAVSTEVGATGPDCRWGSVTSACAPNAPPSTGSYRLLTRK
jgi:hypothetical protein